MQVSLLDPNRTRTVISFAKELLALLYVDHWIIELFPAFLRIIISICLEVWILFCFWTKYLIRAYRQFSLTTGSTCCCQIILWQKNCWMPWGWRRLVSVSACFFLQYMIDGYLIYSSYTSFPISLFIFFFGRGWAWCCLVLARERKATWVPSLHTVLCGECSLSLELISLGVSNCFSMENQILETGGWVEVIDLHGKWDNQAKPICTTEIYARENDGIKHH